MFDRVIECLEERADMKIHFPLCVSGRPTFEGSRTGTCCSQSSRLGLGATSSRGAEMPAQRSPAPPITVCHPRPLLVAGLSAEVRLLRMRLVSWLYLKAF